MGRFQQKSVIKMVEQGQLALSREHAEKEKDKLHTLRIGSAGCITAEGEFIGANPYMALARFMGYSTKKTLRTYNIFDTGYANEYSWEANLKAADVEFKTEEEYPVCVDVDGYKLTGRPDLVLGHTLDGEFVATQGVELKAMCSSNTVRMFSTEDPKTENLIQAATYSMHLGIPWTLAYSAGFNHFGTKAGKLEFPLHWEEGVLLFKRPAGEVVKTIITADGIMDYYRAIVEAYQTKDHSWFKRANIGYKGQEVNYWDNYNEFLLAVDSSLPWNDWREACEIATKSDWIVQLDRKKGRKDKYYLENTVDSTRSMLYNTLQEVRHELRSTVS